MTEPQAHDAPDEDIITQYRTRKLRHDRLRTSIVLFFALFVLLFAALRKEPPWAGAVAIFAVVGLFALTLVDLSTWRCPRCERSFGRAHDVKFCPNCGAKLQR